MSKTIILLLTLFVTPLFAAEGSTIACKIKQPKLILDGGGWTSSDEFVVIKEFETALVKNENVEGNWTAFVPYNFVVNSYDVIAKTGLFFREVSADEEGVNRGMVSLILYKNSPEKADSVLAGFSVTSTSELGIIATSAWFDDFSKTREIQLTFAGSAYGEGIFPVGLSCSQK